MNSSRTLGLRPWRRRAVAMRRACRWLVHQRFFTVGIFLFILFSSFFILLELTLVPPGVYSWVNRVNDVIGLVFVAELVIRWIAIGRFRTFIREYWLDVLAVLPLLPLRALRFVRILRLVRLLAMLVLVRRHMRVFLYLFRKRFLASVAVALFTLFVLMFCSLAYVHFEMHKGGTDLEQFDRSFWIVLFSLVSDQYAPEYPSSIGGRVVLVCVMFTGMALFAIMTGSVAAHYSTIANAIREGTILGKHDFSDMEQHVVICGFNEHVPVILSEMQADPESRAQNFVVISDMDHLPDMSDAGVDMACVYHVKRDFASAKALQFANLAHASTAVVLADLSRGRSEHDADARSVLTAMTIERMNPAVYTCVELIHEENREHLAMIKVDSVILSNRLASHLMARSTLQPSVMAIYSELFQPSGGNHFHEVAFPGDHVGRRFEDLLEWWAKHQQAILVGVLGRDGGVRLNPTGYAVTPGDRAIVMARAKPRKGT